MSGGLSQKAAAASELFGHSNYVNPGPVLATSADWGKAPNRNEEARRLFTKTLEWLRTVGYRHPPHPVFRSMGVRSTITAWRIDWSDEPYLLVVRWIEAPSVQILRRNASLSSTKWDGPAPLSWNEAPWGRPYEGVAPDEKEVTELFERALKLRMGREQRAAAKK